MHSTTAIESAPSTGDAAGGKPEDVDPVASTYEAFFMVAWESVDSLDRAQGRSASSVAASPIRSAWREHGPSLKTNQLWS